MTKAQIDKRHANHRQTFKAALTLLLLVVCAISAAARDQTRPAPSTDRDNPTPLASNVITGDGVDEKTEYFYSFTAGPGDVNVTLDVKAEKGTAVSSVDIALFDAKSNKLLSTYANPDHGGSKRAVESVKVRGTQTLLLEVTVSQGVDNFRVKLGGATEVAPSTDAGGTAAPDSTAPPADASSQREAPRPMPLLKSVAVAASKGGEARAVTSAARQTRTANAGNTNRRPQPAVAEPAVLIAQGRGARRPRALDAVKVPALRPVPLDAALLRSIVRRAPGRLKLASLASADVPAADFVTLSARQPAVDGKGFLEFNQASTGEVLDPTFGPKDSPLKEGMYLAVWNLSSAPTGRAGLGISLKPDHAGQTFVLSIKLLAWEGDAFQVFLPDGHSETYHVTVQGKSFMPLLILFTAQSTDWQLIEVSRGDSPHIWFFDDCEVKTVQL